MFLSIIIPVYNVEKYIGRCLESIISQKAVDFKFEILLINDGSTDQSLSIINEYELKYSFIKVIDQKNRGAGSARNNGLKNALGTHVWFIDSDDFIENNALAVISSKAQYLENGTTLGFGYIAYDNDTGSKKICCDVAEDDGVAYKSIEYTFARKPFYLWNMIYDLSIIKENNIKFIEGIKNIEDFEFNLKYFDKCNNVFFFNDKLYNYCNNGQSTTRNLGSENLMKIAADSYEVHKEIKNNLDNNKYKNIGSVNYWLNYSVSGFMYSLINLNYSSTDIQKYYSIYRKINLIPIENFSRFKFKMKFFNIIVNIPFLFKLICNYKKSK